MSLKQSMEENKQHILDSLPTQELKDSFLADLDKVEEETIPSVEDQIKEAQAPDHIAEDLYDNIKNELKAAANVVKMTAEEEKAAIEEALKNPPKSEEE